MNLGLEGKVALVTGGSQGIGRASALRLAAEGTRVAIVARGAEALERTTAALRAAGAEPLAVQADVSRAEDCVRTVSEVVAGLGGLDILVNNAGTSATGEFETVSDAAWQADFDLKLFAAVRLARLAIPHMQRGGRWADHQYHQYRRQAAARALDADDGDARRGPCADQGTFQGVRGTGHPRQYDLHRPGARRSA